MRRAVTFLLLAGAGLACKSTPGRTLVLESSGIERFWEVADTLRADREPSDALWNALWSTPGYAMLEAREHRRAAVSNAMRFAFRPSLATGRDSVLAAGGWTPRSLRHLLDVAAQRDTLSRFVGDLLSGGLTERSMDLVQRYLPRGTTHRVPPPEVSLMYFLDLRGYPRLLIDPSYFMHHRNPEGVLAHELHHYYNGRLDRPYADFGDDLLAWALSTTESEGIPGLLDKPDVPSMTPEDLARFWPDSANRAYWTMYVREYRQPGPRLRQVESVLERVGAHPDSASALGSWLSDDLPDNGRILGAFMAVTIERAFGRDSLANLVGLPFDFWRVYGDAASRVEDAPPGLSSAALDVLGAVERRHRRAG